MCTASVCTASVFLAIVYVVTSNLIVPTSASCSVSQSLKQKYIFNKICFNQFYIRSFQTQTWFLSGFGSALKMYWTDCQTPAEQM